MILACTHLQTNMFLNKRAQQCKGQSKQANDEYYSEFPTCIGPSEFRRGVVNGLCCGERFHSLAI